MSWWAIVLSPGAMDDFAYRVDGLRVVKMLSPPLFVNFMRILGGIPTLLDIYL